MNYTEKWGFKESDYKGASIDGEYALERIAYFNESELPFVKMSISDFDEYKDVKVGLFKAKFIKYEKPIKCAMLLIDDTGCDKDAHVTDDDLIKFCKDNNLKFIRKNAESYIFKYASNAPTDPLKIAMDLQEIAPEKTSMFTLKADNSFTSSVSIKAADNVVREFNCFTFAMFEDTVYDIVNGLVGITLWEYLKEIHKINDMLRFDPTMTDINPNFKYYLTDEQMLYINVMLDRRNCRITKRFIDACINKK